MKFVFLGVFVILLIASGVTALMNPSQQSRRPVIYWVTDSNPARIKQIELFHQWMIRNGHTSPHGGSAVELRLDTANNDLSKKVIQAVSGVAGDVMDMYSGGDIRYFQSMGVLHDVTREAAMMGFDPSQTYAAVEAEIIVDGRQYSFPCNVTAAGYWVNNDVFAKAGMPSPPSRWTIDEFERIGKELVHKANIGRKRREVFFCAQPDYVVLCRSLGLDRFNETMTRCTLDDPRYVEVLQRIHKWTYDDNIIPTPDDMDAFSTQRAGYGGNQLQLFNRGNFAMVYSGRYALIQLRNFNQGRRERGETPLDMAVVEPPHGGFPNTSVSTRAATIYIGSRHKEFANYFLSFLASEEYNMQIVEDADALPPNPIYTRTNEYKRPPKYPEEWSVHEPWSEFVETIAIPASYSPFVLDRVAMRIQADQVNAFLAHLVTSDAAARRTAEQVNAEIARRLAEEPAQQPLYEKGLTNQKRIEELRSNEELVPLELITNPFHRRYYVAMGWSK